MGVIKRQAHRNIAGTFLGEAHLFTGTRTGLKPTSQGFVLELGLRLPPLQGKGTVQPENIPHCWETLP